MSTLNPSAMKRFIVPQLPFRGPTDNVLTFPSSWDVEMRKMDGHDRTPVSLDDVRAALAKPIGTPTLRELAKGKKEVVIILDDNTRGIRWEMIANAVLEELEAGGIEPDNIRFIMALGLHGTVGRTTMIEKLSEDIVRNYDCFNHNAFTMCKKIGRTKTWDIEVHANEEVMACDLKIGLGAITPHPINGFGGGSKIIMPGIVSHDTIVAHHTKSFEIAVNELNASIAEDRAAKVGLGQFDENDAPAVAADDDMAELVGLDFIVNVTVNGYGKPVAVFPGDFREAFKVGVEDGRTNYATEGKTEQDIVIGNCFYKANEDMIGLTAAPRSLKRTGGTFVLISNCPEGAANHYFAGTWGKIAKLAHTTPVAIPNYIDRLIVQNAYPYKGSYWAMEPADKIINTTSWDETMALLKKFHPGDPSVVVYPDVTIQYPRPKGAFKQQHPLPTH